MAAIPLTLKIYTKESGKLLLARDFHQEAIVVGRSPGVHLQLEDQNVSRVHAAILAIEEKVGVSGDGAGIFQATITQIRVVDLSSSNGVCLNGQRVQSTAMIGERDRITVGDFIIEVTRKK